MKKLLGILFVLALIASPAFALDYMYDGGGMDTLNDMVNDYDTIEVWDDMGGNPSTLVIDYAQQLTNGYPRYVSPFDGSTMIINDGEYHSFVGAPFYYTLPGPDYTAYDATLEINGGDFHYRIKGDDGVLKLVVNGGNFNNLYDTGSGTYMQSSMMELNGGTWTPGAASEYRIVGGGDMTITGGTYSTGVNIRSGPNMRIKGGDFDHKLYFLYSDGPDNTSWITGGDFTGLTNMGAYSYEGSVHIAGGQFSQNTIWADEMRRADSEYHFYGLNFSATSLGTGVNPSGGTEYYYQVQGILCDGNAFNMYGTFWDRDDTGNMVSFTFHPCCDVPEPTTVALLGLGALGLVGARRRRK